MKFSLPINIKAYQKQFNFHLMHKYDVQSIIHTDSEVLIVANITEDQKTEIEEYYNSLDGFASFYLDPDFGDGWVAIKYEINEEEGRKYKHLISAKIINMVTSGSISSEEAEEYSRKTSVVRQYLGEGYWNSAYYEIINLKVSGSLSALHFEIMGDIKKYVNDKYPDNFKID